MKPHGAFWKSLILFAPIIGFVLIGNTACTTNVGQTEVASHEQPIKTEELKRFTRFISVHPATYTDTDLYASSSRLLGAPVLNRTMIMQLGNQLEKDLHDSLLQNRISFIKVFCRTPTDRQIPLLHELEAYILNGKDTVDKAQQHHNKWIRIFLEDRLPTNRRVYEHSRQKRPPSPSGGREFLLESEIQVSLDRHNAVELLRADRTQALAGSWTDLLKELREMEPTGEQKSCLQQTIPAEVRSRTRLKKKLTAPVILALYHFYNSLVPAVRIELIESLNRQK